MSDEKIPSFSNPQEEIKFWKEKYAQMKNSHKELQSEYDEYQTSQNQLVRELEKNLEVTEKQAQEYKTKFNRLKTEFDDQIEKTKRNTGDSNKMIADLQDQVNKSEKSLNELRLEKRNLEIENDNLERKERELSASFQDLSEKLNKLLEEHAWVTTELEEQKIITQETSQRMKDEMRELQTELSVIHRTTSDVLPPTNHTSNVSSPVVETNGVSTRGTSIDLADELLALIKEMDRKISAMPKFVLKRSLSTLSS